MSTEPLFEGWAIVELMGHRRLAGYLTEVQIAGHGFLRLDVPPALAADDDSDGGATQFYAPASVYAITPTTEEVVRAVRVAPEPVHTWELPRQIESGVGF
jgi:hypothetical protein